MYIHIYILYIYIYTVYIQLLHYKSHFFGGNQSTTFLYRSLQPSPSPTLISSRFVNYLDAVSVTSASDMLNGTISRHFGSFLCHKSTGSASFLATLLFNSSPWKDRSTIFHMTVNHLFRLGPSTNHGYRLVITRWFFFIAIGSLWWDGHPQRTEPQQRTGRNRRMVENSLWSPRIFGPWKVWKSHGKSHRQMMIQKWTLWIYMVNFHGFSMYSFAGEWASEIFYCHIMAAAVVFEWNRQYF